MEWTEYVVRCKDTDVNAWGYLGAWFGFFIDTWDVF